MEELVKLILVGLVALWIGYKLRKNSMEEEIKIINKNIFSLMDEVQADIADTRIERGSLMVQLEEMMNSLEKYEQAYQTRLEEENGKSKTKKPNEQKDEEITNSPS